MANKSYFIISNVVSKTSVDGMHNWPNAPEQFGYLSFPHRHIFNIEAHKRVHHDDRDVEFINLARDIKLYLIQKYYSLSAKCCLFGSKSCEMLASELATEFDLCECSVFEDNENGATARRSETINL